MPNDRARTKCTCGWCKKEFTMSNSLYNMRINKSKSGKLFHNDACFKAWLASEEGQEFMRKSSVARGKAKKPKYNIQSKRDHLMSLDAAIEVAGLP